MCHLLEALGNIAAHALGGRRGVEHLGMSILELLQFAQQGIKFEITYCGS